MRTYTMSFISTIGSGVAAGRSRHVPARCRSESPPPQAASTPPHVAARPPASSSRRRLKARIGRPDGTLIPRPPACSSRGVAVLEEQRVEVVALARHVSQHGAVAGFHHQDRGDRLCPVDALQLGEQRGVGGHQRRLEVIAAAASSSTSLLEGVDLLRVQALVAPPRGGAPEQPGQHVGVGLVVLADPHEHVVVGTCVDGRPVQVARRQLDRLHGTQQLGVRRVGPVAARCRDPCRH